MAKACNEWLQGCAEGSKQEMSWKIVSFLFSSRFFCFGENQLSVRKSRKSNFPITNDALFQLTDQLKHQSTEKFPGKGKVAAKNLKSKFISTALWHG